MRYIKKKAIFITLSFCCVLLLLVAAVFIVSANYQEIYNKPRVSNAVMDCKGFDSIAKQPVANPLSGEWEFFYGKWIVTDGEAGEPDAMINLPKRWTGMKVDGRPLKRMGYASYRIKIINLSNIERLRVFANKSTVSYRVFINGELNVTEGIISKSLQQTFATATKNTVQWYHPAAGEELTVVIEVSNNNQGGLYQTPWFDVAESDATSIADFVGSFPMILLGGMIVLLLFCIVVPFQFSRRENFFTFPILLTAIIFHFLTAKEMSVWIFNLFSLNYLFVPMLRYFTASLLMVSFLAHLIQTKVIKISRRESTVFLFLNAAAFVSYFLLLGSILQIFPMAISFLTMLYIFYKIERGNEKKSVRLTYLLINFILLFILIPESIDSQGLIVYGLETAVSVGLVLLIVVIAGVYFYKIRESQKRIILANRLEKEIAVVKMQTLKAQIKPHFIFNSLSAIQDIYRNAPSEGEEMLSNFANHLRVNVDSDKKDLISFENELNNALNYFELENLRYEKKLTLILNIDYTDFVIPPLSLQPLLENAINHGKTHEKKEGKIEISTYRIDSGEIIVEIFDNGCGFDLAAVRPEATGIINVRERLKYTLNATVKIKSTIDVGTTVEIIIPMNGG